MQKTTAVSSVRNDFFTGQSGMTGPLLFITGYVLYRLFLQEKATPGSVPPIRNPSVAQTSQSLRDDQSSAGSLDFSKEVNGPQIERKDFDPYKNFDSITSIKPKSIERGRTRILNIVIPKIVPASEKISASGPCRNLPLDKALDKMAENAAKALEEAKKKDPAGNYPIWEIGDLSHCVSSLSFEIESSRLVSSKKMNEDRFCVLPESGKGTLLAVLDGHGGFDVAEYGKRQLSDRFFTVLEEKEGNVHAAFEQILFDINQEVLKKKEWLSQGAVLVMSYIEEKTGRIYTVTLGDCEAKIYRKQNTEVTTLERIAEQNNEWGTIPLSCVRDWGCEREQKRLHPILGEDFSQRFQVLLENSKIDNPKLLRVFRCDDHHRRSTNVSRALGDGYYSIGLETPVISGKGKITVAQLEPGDVLILGSDGLWDFVKEKDIYQFLKSGSRSNFPDNSSMAPPTSAEILADFARTRRGSEDDITVIKVDIK